MKRKCTECGDYMIFNKDNTNNVIRFEKKYYHHDCFLNMCKRKSEKTNASPKWSKALASIDKIKQETKNYFDSNNDSPKDILYRFILSNYENFIKI